MGLIGADRREVMEKCVSCEKTFPEDELDLQPYEKTKTIELMCKECKKISQKNDLPITTEKKEDVNKITTEKKSNTLKQIVNEEAVPIKTIVTCTCAKFPLCKAIRATQAWDEFSNKEIRAYFVVKDLDFYKIDFCPFCGKRLYK